VRSEEAQGKRHKARGTRQEAQGKRHKARGTRHEFFTKIPSWTGLPTDGRMGGFRSEARGSLPAGRTGWWR